MNSNEHNTAINDNIQKDVSIKRRERYSTDDIRSAMKIFMISAVCSAGFSMIAGGSILTTFLTKYLHTTNVEYARLMSFFYLSIVGTFIGTYLVARTGRTKPFLMSFTLPGRILLMLLSVLILVLSPEVLIKNIGILFIVCWIMFGIGDVGWMPWMSDIMPSSITGKIFGTRARLTMLTLVVLSIILPALITYFNHSRYIYAIVIAICGLIGSFDTAIQSKIKEIPRPVPTPLPNLYNMFIEPWKNPFLRGIAAYFL